MRQTNWCIITGAPCSGKTAVIDEIKRRGIRVIHEVARAYIDRQLKKGLQLRQIKTDALQFERHILHEKVRIQASLPATATIFFDRGIPDSIAYFKLEGLDPTEPLRYSPTGAWIKGVAHMLLELEGQFIARPVAQEERSR